VLRAGEHQQRIAIWRGILNGSRTDGSARTRPIIDTNPLANSARYRFCIDARRDVGDAAGGEPDDKGYSFEG